MDGCIITDGSVFCSVLLYVDTRLRFSAYRPGSLGRLETQIYHTNDPSDCLMSHGWPLCFFGCAVGTARQRRLRRRKAEAGGTTGFFVDRGGAIPPAMRLNRIPLSRDEGRTLKCMESRVEK